MARVRAYAELRQTLLSETEIEPGLRRELATRLDKLGVIIVGSTAAELAAHLKTEMERWEPVIKRANIKVQE